MTERIDKREAADESAEEAAIRRLIAAAGRGPAAAPAARARIYSAAQTAWRGSIERRRRRRVLLAAAAAVAAVVVGTAALVGQRPSAPAAPAERIAQVGRIQGGVYVIRGGRQVMLGDPALADLRAGDTLVTRGDGRAALALAGGLSLRIDGATLLVFESAHEASLDHGTIYLDSGHAPGADGRKDTGGAAAFAVATPFGTVSHLGTQYELEVERKTLTLKVREGSVAIGRPAGRLVGQSGEELTVHATGAPQRAHIDTQGPAWSWAENLAAVPREDRYPAFALLRWVARQTGRRLEFANPGVEAKARATLLHGVEGLTPSETLEVLRGTTNLAFKLEGNVLLVTAPAVGAR